VVKRPEKPSVSGSNVVSVPVDKDG
jgi:hypothetical protein